MSSTFTTLSADSGQERPPRGRPPFRDNPRLILVGIGVLVALLVAILTVANRSPSLTPDYLAEFVLYALIAADLTMVVALVFVLARNIVKLVVEAQVYNTGLRGVFVINRVVAKTAISRDVAEALKDYPFPLLQTAIAQRVVFAESAAAGLSVLEYAPRSPAAGEMRTLLREIEGLMACVTR